MLILVFSGLSGAVSAQYQTDLFDLTLEELLSVRVVSSVSGIEQDLKLAPASATIIEAEQWQRRGARTLSQALLGVPGLQSTVLSSTNSERNVVIRGLSGNFGQQIKLLLDGIPFNRIHHGGKPALDIPLLGFKRIEIVRSPGSATYGADAFAGVINLISEDNVDKAEQVMLSLGEFENYDLGITGGTKLADAELIYTLNYSKYGDDPDRIISSDFQTQLDALFNIDASLAPGRFNQSYEEFSVNLKANWQGWAVSYYGITGSFGFGAGVAEALDPSGKGEHYSQILDVKYQFSLFETDETTLNLWWQDKHSEFPFTIFPAGAVLPIGQDGNLDFNEPTTFALFEDGYKGEPSNDSELTHFSITQVVSPNSNHTLRWQLGYEHHEHVPSEKKNFGPGVLDGTELIVTGELTDVSSTPYSYLPERSRHLHFFSIQDTWQLNDDWSFHFGGRFDDYSDFGSTTNPRLGLVWQASEQLTVKLLSARAFRAPGFFDRYAVNNPVNLGNPDLKPEVINTNELNFGFTPSENLFMELSYYRYRAKDIIQYIDVVGMTGRQAQNIGTIDGAGAEWSFQWRATADLDIAGNISLVENENEFAEALAGFSERMASLTVNYQINDKVDINVFWQHFSELNRASSDQRKPIGAANWSSVKLGFEVIPEQLNVALVVNNLFDDESYTPSSSIPDDYPIAGRQWLLQLEYNFD